MHFIWINNDSTGSIRNAYGMIKYSLQSKWIWLYKIYIIHWVTKFAVKLGFFELRFIQCIAVWPVFNGHREKRMTQTKEFLPSKQEMRISFMWWDQKIFKVHRNVSDKHFNFSTISTKNLSLSWFSENFVDPNHFRSLVIEKAHTNYPWAELADQFMRLSNV